MSDRPTEHNRVCPWWLCFTFDNPLRRLLHDPDALLSPYVRSGKAVIDVGAGRGYFTIPLARLVGPAGHVVAIDIQTKMLAALAGRARKHGVLERITPHLASPQSLGRHPKADFILAFWVAHEVPDQCAFFTEISGLLEADGRLLLVEPTLHVPMNSFMRTVQTASETGFIVKDRPKIRLSHSVLLGLH